MLRKIIIILISILIMMSMSGSVNAAELETRLDIIQQASEKQYLENNQGYISKTIVNSSSNVGEVTIQLKLENIRQNTNSENKIYDDTEILIIIPEYINAVGNEKITYIETLADKILSKNSRTKIGIIGIQGPISDTYIEDGKIIENEGDETGVKGTEDNAEYIVQLTDNIDTIKSELRSMNSEGKEYYSNVQAALRLARKSFSNNVNKILISLYDNVPSTAIGISNLTPSYGGGNQYTTAEEAVRAHLNDLVSYTKAEILSLKNEDIQFILLRPDNTLFDSKWYSYQTGELTVEIDGKPYADELYGTIENPTYGKMYSLNDDSLEKIVTEYIYDDIMQTIQPNMEEVVIKDYFPKEINNNFDITILDKNVSSVDITNLETDGYIIWNIGTLEGNKSITLEYTLKIKDMKNTELLDKTIATNEKVVLTYKDTEAKDYTVTLTSSPKIQLSEVKEELTATVSYDPTSETTGTVKVTIKTNKKVNKVEGWTLSDDGMILTKVYSKNTTETVHLVDLDGMTKDVKVSINNIKSQNEDNTTAKGKLPQTGASMMFAIGSIIAIILIAVIFYKKYNSYKEIN